MKLGRRSEGVDGRVCVYWLQGRCNRNPCRFLHRDTLPPPQSAVVNRHKRTPPQNENAPIPIVLNKKTRVGSYSYSYSYSSPSTENNTPNPKHNSKKPSLTLCKYWVTGNCTHGDRCLYLHSWHYGDGLSTIAKLHQHKKVVTGIALPTGSDKLYSGSTDGTVCTWDCHTGQCANLTNLGAEVTTLICEGPWIFAGLMSAVKVAVVKAWHIETASEFTLVGPKGRVLAMIVGNDTLCAAAEDGVISAWRGSSDPKSPFELVASLTGHTKAVSCLHYGACKRLYSGSMDQSIKVWDLDTLECIMTLKGHTGEVTSLICWDRYLLSGSSDCTIKVWAAKEEGPLEVTHTHTLDYGVVALNGMNAEKTHILFCSCRDNSVRLLGLPSFSERGRLFAKKEIKSIEIGPGGLFFTGDGTGLVMVWKWLQEKLE